MHTEHASETAPKVAFLLRIPQGFWAEDTSPHKQYQGLACRYLSHIGKFVELGSLEKASIRDSAYLR